MLGSSVKWSSKSGTKEQRNKGTKVTLGAVHISLEKESMSSIPRSKKKQNKDVIILGIYMEPKIFERIYH